MTAPISFTVRPPAALAPYRPSPLANGSRTNSRAGPPSRRLFENGQGESDDEDEDGLDRRVKAERSDRGREEQGSGSRNGQGSGSGYAQSPSKTSVFADAHSAQKSSASLVIPALPNRNWRENSSRNVPSFRPEAPKREASDMITHERIGDGPAKVGLERFGKKREADVDVKDEDGDVKMEVKLEEGAAGPSSGSSILNDPQVKKEPLSLEEQALQEILAGEVKQETAEDRAQRELVIAMQDNRGRVMSETEALQQAIKTLPAESTLEDFEAVPISAFGIAALRGMGWDPKSTENVKAREVQRRPQLLGLGATPMAVDMPAGSGKSRKELEREKEKREKKKSRDEKTGRGFSAASLLQKIPNGSGSSTPVIGSRAGSIETGTDSDGSRRRRREDEASSGRESKRRDDRDRDGDRYETEEERARRKARERDGGGDRYETEEERARRKAKERERNGNGDKYERSDRDRDRRDRDDGRDRRDRDGKGRDDDRDRRRERF